MCFLEFSFTTCELYLILLYRNDKKLYEDGVGNKLKTTKEILKLFRLYNAY